jgi:HEAT repeat protein
VPAIAAAAAADAEFIANTAVNTLGDIGTDDAAEALGALATNVSIDMGRRRSAILSLQRIQSETAASTLAAVATAVADEEGADELREALS